MILVVVKFTIRPDRTGDWFNLVDDFTEATRQEPGNLFFEWSRNVAVPNQFILLEAFASRAAGEAHVRSAHFMTAMAWMPEVIATKPEIIHVEVPGAGWSQMAELTPAEGE